METDTKQKTEFAFYRKGCLLLKRTAGQGFRIGANIDIEIARIDGSTIYLAVFAPNEHVLRHEIMRNEPRPKTDAATD